MKLTLAMYAKIHNLNLLEQNDEVKEYLQVQLDRCETESRVLMPICWRMDVFMQIVPDDRHECEGTCQHG